MDDPELAKLLERCNLVEEQSRQAQEHADILSAHLAHLMQRSNDVIARMQRLPLPEQPSAERQDEEAA